MGIAIACFSMVLPFHAWNGGRDFAIVHGTDTSPEAPYFGTGTRMGHEPTGTGTGSMGIGKSQPHINSESSRLQSAVTLDTPNSHPMLPIIFFLSSAFLFCFVLFCFVVVLFVFLFLSVNRNTALF